LHAENTDVFQVYVKKMWQGSCLLNYQ
jgi:hypothetical protein